jgi:hypothetical protein
MIHRTYICRLAPLIQAFPNLDIVVGAPGSRAAPVLNAALYPPGTPATTPPTGWVSTNGANWYYEVRGRALRLEQTVGVSGFTPRTNLSYHLSILALQASDGSGNSNNLLPALSLSASLAPAPVVNSLLAPATAYNVALPDPAYGPIIRVWSASTLFPSGEHGGQLMIYQIDFRIAENKDEDFSTLGHA